MSNITNTDVDFVIHISADILNQLLPRFLQIQTVDVPIPIGRAANDPDVRAIRGLLGLVCGDYFTRIPLLYFEGEYYPWSSNQQDIRLVPTIGVSGFSFPLDNIALPPRLTIQNTRVIQRSDGLYLMASVSVDQGRVIINGLDVDTGSGFDLISPMGFNVFSDGFNGSIEPVDRSQYNKLYRLSLVDKPQTEDRTANYSTAVQPRMIPAYPEPISYQWIVYDEGKISIDPDSSDGRFATRGDAIRFVGNSVLLNSSDPRFLTDFWQPVSKTGLNVIGVNALDINGRLIDKFAINIPTGGWVPSFISSEFKPQLVVHVNSTNINPSCGEFVEFSVEFESLVTWTVLPSDLDLEYTWKVYKVVAGSSPELVTNNRWNEFFENAPSPIFNFIEPGFYMVSCSVVGSGRPLDYGGNVLGVGATFINIESWPGLLGFISNLTSTVNAIDSAINMPNHLGFQANPVPRPGQGNCAQILAGAGIVIPPPSDFPAIDLPLWELISVLNQREGTVLSEFVTEFIQSPLDEEDAQRRRIWFGLDLDELAEQLLTNDLPPGIADLESKLNRFIDAYSGDIDLDSIELLLMKNSDFDRAGELLLENEPRYPAGRYVYLDGGNLALGFSLMWWTPFHETESHEQRRFKRKQINYFLGSEPSGLRNRRNPGGYNRPVKHYVSDSDYLVSPNYLEFEQLYDMNPMLPGELSEQNGFAVNIGGVPNPGGDWAFVLSFSSVDRLIRQIDLTDQEGLEAIRIRNLALRHLLPGTLRIRLSGSLATRRAVIESRQNRMSESEKSAYKKYLDSLSLGSASVFPSVTLAYVMFASVKIVPRVVVNTALWALFAAGRELDFQFEADVFFGDSSRCFTCPSDRCEEDDYDMPLAFADPGFNPFYACYDIADSTITDDGELFVNTGGVRRGFSGMDQKVMQGNIGIPNIDDVAIMNRGQNVGSFSIDWIAPGATILVAVGSITVDGVGNNSHSLREESFLLNPTDVLFVLDCALDKQIGSKGMTLSVANDQGISKPNSVSSPSISSLTDMRTDFGVSRGGVWGGGLNVYPDGGVIIVELLNTQQSDQLVIRDIGLEGVDSSFFAVTFEDELGRSVNLPQSLPPGYSLIIKIRFVSSRAVRGSFAQDRFERISTSIVKSMANLVTIPSLSTTGLFEPHYPEKVFDKLDISSIMSNESSIVDTGLSRQRGHLSERMFVESYFPLLHRAYSARLAVRTDRGVKHVQVLADMRKTSVEFSREVITFDETVFGSFLNPVSGRAGEALLKVNISPALTLLNSGPGILLYCGIRVDSNQSGLLITSSVNANSKVLPGESVVFSLEVDARYEADIDANLTVFTSLGVADIPIVGSIRLSNS